MKSQHYFYSSSIDIFLKSTKEEVLGIICLNNPLYSTNNNQHNTWEEQINILQKQLKNINDGGCILFEYVIPRMGKRVDAILLYKNIIFVIEFKCGATNYFRSAVDQVYDYALDLKNFHKESHNKLLVPILVSTEAPLYNNKYIVDDGLAVPLLCNKDNLLNIIGEFISKFNYEPPFNYDTWINSQYSPTPTIVEAAQALYNNHSVEDITKNEAGVENLSKTTDELKRIIEWSINNEKKSICFVTGVPGAGKTLAGLNIAVYYSNDEKRKAVFLSGNYPLVTVLQEALARDKKERSNIRKSIALSETKLFIQIIHHYRDEYVNNKKVPLEHITIFDEAQRAWTKEQIQSFMKNKKGIKDFNYSEPEFLIETMNRHDKWGVIICLIGGGQEINTGEAGISEWFDSLKRSFKDWNIFVTPQLKDSEYKMNNKWDDLKKELNIHISSTLHLSTSIRSFRTPELAGFIKAILDVSIEDAKNKYDLIKNKYPIYVTRNINIAKEWVKSKSKGTTKYGLLASSGGLRLKPEGIFVKNEINVANWFLNDKEDVRSCYALEDVVTEFDIQGLEIDYSIVAWDANFRFNVKQNNWEYYSFKGNKWNNINKEEDKLYLKNAYRVLLTRARQGMVIFIPKGNDEDLTRKHEYYDGIFYYLKNIGIEEI